ncbi:response regulator [Roseovarius salis]|uniref:response regulator n=1 Tax=Roseovarius salis TaxID=3376063 RepID=UPI0037CBB90C
MKILVADDEPLFLELIAGHLGALGYHDVHPVGSAAGALQAIEESAAPFDCFLLDIRMPGMDGIELCGRIRAMPDYAVTPIVMITSMKEKTFVDRAFRAGANDYVNKPIDHMEVEARMGMVEALVTARGDASQLMKQLGEATSGGHGRIALGEPVELEEAGGVMPVSSMENYLLRLGKMRVFSCASIGLHIENAGVIHGRTDGQDFVDILGEVAVAIRESLHDASTLLSYAGNGDFCAIMSRATPVDTAELELRINDRISQRLNLLRGTDVPMPAVKVGPPQSAGLMPFDDPTALIYKAIDAASPEPRRGAEAAGRKGGYRHAG